MSCQHKFIAFADYLPHKGVDGLIRDVHTSVESVMKRSEQGYLSFCLYNLGSDALCPLHNRGWRICVSCDFPLMKMGMPPLVIKLYMLLVIETLWVFEFRGSQIITGDCLCNICPACSKSLKEAYRISHLRDLFLQIQQSFQENQERWVQYVLPEDNILPDDLAAASSAADAARLSMSEPSAADDAEKLEQLMFETRNVLTR